MMHIQNRKSTSRFLLIVVVAAAIFNVAFLEYNNARIRQANPANTARNAASLVYGQTVYSIDNEYYLSPVDNYVEGRGWKRSPAVSDGDYFRRVPGYSIIYYSFVKVFGKPAGHLMLKIFQVLLFLAGIPVIYFLCRRVAGEFSSRLLTVIYAFIPFVSSWSYFTLTEAVSPFLVLYYIYFAIQGAEHTNERSKLRHYILASAFFIAAVLTRPYIALAGLVLFAFSVKDYLFPLRVKGLLRLSVVWAIPVILAGAWTARNYMLTREFVPLEKAYHPQSLDRMKPEFRGMLSFTKSWGEDGAQFTLHHEPFFWPAVAGDTSSAPLQAILESWPQAVINEFGYDRLYHVLKDHQQVIASYKPYYDQKIAMPDNWSASQLQVEKEYNELRQEYKQKHFTAYYIKAPLTYLKRMIVHSNTSNIFIFQEEAGIGKPLLLYKSVLFLLHVAFFFALLLNIVLLRGWTNRLVFVYMPLLFVLFFSFIHREVEARYMLPVLPLLVAGAAGTLDKLLAMVLRRRTNNITVNAT